MKYHINAKGVPSKCTATSRPCPLGGDDAHFDNIKDAQSYADKINSEKYGLVDNPIEKVTQYNKAFTAADDVLSRYYPTLNGYLGDIEEDDFELVNEIYEKNFLYQSIRGDVHTDFMNSNTYSPTDDVESYIKDKFAKNVKRTPNLSPSAIEEMESTIISKLKLKLEEEMPHNEEDFNKITKYKNKFNRHFSKLTKELYPDYKNYRPQTDEEWEDEDLQEDRAFVSHMKHEMLLRLKTLVNDDFKNKRTMNTLESPGKYLSDKLIEISEEPDFTMLDYKDLSELLDTVESLVD